MFDFFFRPLPLQRGVTQQLISTPTFWVAGSSGMMQELYSKTLAGPAGKIEQKHFKITYSNFPGHITTEANDKDTLSWCIIYIRS